MHKPVVFCGGPWHGQIRVIDPRGGFIRVPYVCSENWGVTAMSELNAIEAGFIGNVTYRVEQMEFLDQRQYFAIAEDSRRKE